MMAAGAEFTDSRQQRTKVQLSVVQNRDNPREATAGAPQKVENFGRTPPGPADGSAAEQAKTRTDAVRRAGRYRAA
jgi:hypothetical protein